MVYYQLEGDINDVVLFSEDVLRSVNDLRCFFTAIFLLLLPSDRDFVQYRLHHGRRSRSCYTEALCRHRLF